MDKNVIFVSDRPTAEKNTETFHQFVQKRRPAHAHSAHSTHTPTFYVPEKAGKIMWTFFTLTRAHTHTPRSNVIRYMHVYVEVEAFNLSFLLIAECVLWLTLKRTSPVHALHAMHVHMGVE